MKPESPITALMLGILVMMVLPLPTFLVDTMIAINMTIAVLLMITVLHMHTPLALTSFPAILLMTTLFRLALSIATTRLILLKGDAGHVVETFGRFVVGGNVVVGLTVFLILTIVQFLVITKGSERVAEVGARFSLDALPGKQMAIDGDMRAGLIDGKEAGRRRENLGRESQFYGAMDGAMKFVKGDAIAGLIIVGVNLIGGIAIGVAQRGLSFSQAVSMYSVLTVGDGLVSQIPSLLISVAAGIVVTRVAGPGASSSTGQDVTRQLFSDWRAGVVAGAGIALFGLAPGLPTPIFGVLGGGLATFSFFRRETMDGARRMPGRGGHGEHRGLRGGAGGAAHELGGQDFADESGQGYPFSTPLELQLAVDIPGSIGAAGAGSLETAIERLRGELTLESGVPIAALKISRAARELASGHYRLLVHGVPVLRAQFDGDAGALLSRLRHTLLSHINTMIGVQETHDLLALLAQAYPDLVQELQRLLPEQRVAEILQRLALERVSIRNLRAIAEALVQWAPREKDSVVLTEYVRLALGAQITHQWVDENTVLPAFLLSPDIEERVREAIRQTSGGNYLAMDPGTTAAIVEAVARALEPHRDRRAAILAPMEIRRYVRKVLEADYPEVPVLAYQEISADVEIDALARIPLSVDEARHRAERRLGEGFDDDRE